jgi:hypothetical protein
MTIQKGFTLGNKELLPSPSSGDGSCSPSRFDPNTGAENPSWPGEPQPSSRLSTDGAFNGPVHQCGGGYDMMRDIRSSEQDYRAAEAASSGVHPGGSAGMAVPSLDMLHTGGSSVPSDSNVQSANTGGPREPIIRSSGGGDTDGLRDSNMGAGGRYVG